MKITPALLKKHKACPAQSDLFSSLFPNGVKVTESLCVAYAGKFDWDWAAANLLPASARAAYDAAAASAWATYDTATASARATYEAATASALATYNAARAPAWATYEAATASAFGKIAETLE